MIQCDLCGRLKDEELEMYPDTIVLPYRVQGKIYVQVYNVCDECIEAITDAVEKEIPGKIGRVTNEINKRNRN